MWRNGSEGRRRTKRRRQKRVRFIRQDKSYGPFQEHENCSPCTRHETPSILARGFCTGLMSFMYAAATALARTHLIAKLEIPWSNAVQPVRSLMCSTPVLVFKSYWLRCMVQVRHGTVLANDAGVLRTSAVLRHGEDIISIEGQRAHIQQTTTKLSLK